MSSRIVIAGLLAIAATGTHAQSQSQSLDSLAGGAHDGDEVDAQVLYPAKGTFQVGAKYADYNAVAYSVDTRKAWAWAEYKF